jgi:hypothetical protein
MDSQSGEKEEAMRRKLLMTLGVAVLAASAACTQHRVEVAPVEVKPIHITIDVNVRVDRALDNFFDDIDAAKEKTEPAENSKTN